MARQARVRRSHLLDREVAYEVELKFRVEYLAAVEAVLEKLGTQLGGPSEQLDTYYSHPARDFAQTDEALRIRRQGQETFITYKGPKVDALTKTRREIELPLGRGQNAAEQFGQMLEALGFKPVATVRKLRRIGHLAWQGADVEIAVDAVDGLGPFVELELQSDAEGLDAARQKLASLAEQLQLSNSERRSYLELLLQR